MSTRVLRIIAWWQIVFGILGIATFGALYLELMQYSRAVLDNMGPINYWLGLAFFSFVIAAGRALLKGSAWGLGASCACQALQVVSFAFLGGPVVKIYAGPILGFQISSTFVQLTAGFYSIFFLGTRASGVPFEITVNVLAAVWTSILFRAWLQTKRVVQPSRGLTSA